MGASDPQLIDGHVSLAQSQKAIGALLKYVHKEKDQLEETELLPGKEQHVWLVVTVKRMQPNKTPKPHKIPIVHPLVDPRTSGVCLITKDPQREYKDLLESNDIKFISRVVGLQKLRGKFKGYDARRLLLRENDLFLADERVLPLLPRLLGKKWFEAKKQPIPVSLTKKALKAELENAISSTYMHQNRGTCTSIKIATTSQKDNQVLANFTTALPAVISRIHGGWDNVQSLNIKTSGSVSLPIWSCPLGGEQPGSRWEGMGLEESEWSGFGAETGDVEPIVEPMAGEPVDTPKSNGKKRAADSTETQEGAKRSKKSKISEVSTATTIATAPIAKAKEIPSKPKESSPTIKASKSAKVKSAKESKHAKEPKSPKDIKPAKESKSSKDPKLTEGSEPAELSVKKTKQKRMSAAEPSSLIPPSQAKPTKKPSTDRSLSRTELTEKKDTLGDAQLAKKKGKLRDTEKSARKGVKAQLVGRSKA